MARICLVRLPFFKIYGIEKVHFPLSIGYLASYLEARGHRTSFIDGEIIDYKLYEGPIYKGIANAILFYADPYFMDKRSETVAAIMNDRRHRVWGELVSRIAGAKPDVIGMSCYTVNMTAANILSERIKSEIGDIPIVAGGIHPTSLPRETLEEAKAVDYVVVGEGEESFSELVNSIGKNGMSGRSLSLDGVMNRRGGPFKPRSLIQDLDSIPFPKRDFHDRSNYIFGAPLLTSRGCPFSCTFCASHLTWTRKVRYRSVQNVIEELIELKKKSDVKRIRVLDDTFVLNKKWITEFCDSLKKNNLKFNFNCSGRINTVDEELFRVLSENGFDSIAFGIESGSPSVIKRIKKDIDLSKVAEVIRLANKYGFDTTSFYMTGHPGETLNDIKKSEELFVKSLSKRGELSMLVPYAGTDSGSEARRKGFKADIDNCYKLHHARNNVIFNLTALSDRELLAEHNKFEKIIKYRNYTTLFKKLIRLAIYFVTRRLD